MITALSDSSQERLVAGFIESFVNLIDEEIR